MKDRQQVEKVEQMQVELLGHLRKLDEEGELTSDVRKAIERAEKWDGQVEDASRDDVEPRRWEPHELAHVLHKHIAGFPKEIRQEVQEYCYAVDKLPYDADETLGV